MIADPVSIVEPCVHGRPISAVEQGAGLWKTFHAGGPQGRREAVPAHVGADETVQLAVAQEEGDPGVHRSCIFPRHALAKASSDRLVIASPWWLRVRSTPGFTMTVPCSATPLTAFTNGLAASAQQIGDFGRRSPAQEIQKPDFCF
jgi:hypothetical protein